MNRLNDWFSDLYQNRTSTSGSNSVAAGTIASQQQIHSINSANTNTQNLPDSSDNDINYQAQVYQRNEFSNPNSNTIPEFKTIR